MTPALGVDLCVSISNRPARPCIARLLGWGVLRCDVMPSDSRHLLTPTQRCCYCYTKTAALQSLPLLFASLCLLRARSIHSLPVAIVRSNPSTHQPAIDFPTRPRLINQRYATHLSSDHAACPPNTTTSCDLPTTSPSHLRDHIYTTLLLRIPCRSCGLC